MKKTVTIVVLLYVLAIALSGCGASTVALGIYQNANDAEQKVVITENIIQFINVSFDEFNEELHQDMGIDFHLTEFMNGENAYTCKDGVLSVDVQFGIAVTFAYGKNYIIVNGETFKLC